MRWWRVLNVSALVAMLIQLQGCTLEGACEYGYTSTGNYYCSNESDTNIFPLSADDVCYWGDVSHLHENSSCSSIGYNLLYSSDTYRYNSAGDPSPYGYFGSGYGGGGGGGGGGGSGGSLNCDTVWTGSPSDIQVSSECQTACVYYNAGYQPGVDAACSIVAGWGATSSCTVCH